MLFFVVYSSVYFLLVAWLTRSHEFKTENTRGKAVGAVVLFSVIYLILIAFTVVRAN